MHAKPRRPFVARPGLLALCVTAGLALCVAPARDARAQERVDVPAPSDTLYQVRLTDGSVLYARIAEVSADRVVLTTSGGARVELDRAQIREVRAARGRVVDGEYRVEDPSATRLFFTATGRSLRAGEAYVGTYLIVLPFLAFGVTNRFTLAAGAPVLFGEFEPFYVAPKLQVVRRERFQLSLGTLAFFFQDENVGIAYGVGTFGDADDAFTAGVGFGYSGADFSSQPVGMVGGEARVSRRVKLLTENYFLPGETGFVFSGGLRFVGDRLSTDVGVAGGVGEDGEGGCCVPMLNFAYAFGRGR